MKLSRLSLFFITALSVTASAQLTSQLTSQLTATTLPDAPSATLLAAAEPAAAPAAPPTSGVISSLNPDAFATLFSTSADTQEAQQTTTLTPVITDKKKPAPVPVDANGNPIPLNRQQPQRILGFMPNFRSVSAGSAPHPPGWKYNFTVATHQALDYSSFIFLGLTTLSAEGINEHPVLGKGVDGFYAYGWRGLLDKTDGTYLGAWFLPSLLHEDTRYYAKGPGHSIVYRALYVMSRQVVTRTYGGRDIPNIAGLGGKVLTQIVSRTYYPTGATSFGVLAEKFAYSAMRDIAFTSIREFYPDIAAHYVKKHHEKIARLAAKDGAAAASQSSQPTPAPGTPR